MAINIYDSAFDESHGFSPEEASNLIPRVELEEPYNEGEALFVTYWKHMRKCQLWQKEYQINPTEANLKQILSLPFELPPPYGINWVRIRYRKQAEHFDQLRKKMIMVKPEN